jgi:prevent-host-death family protein
MKTASITEAKNRLSALLDEVRAGETVIITDRGKPVARLEPAASSDHDEEGRIARLERSGILSPPRNPQSIEWILRNPPPRVENQDAVLKALLEERRAGR